MSDLRSVYLLIFLLIISSRANRHYGGEWLQKHEKSLQKNAAEGIRVVVPNYTLLPNKLKGIVTMVQYIKY